MYLFRLGIGSVLRNNNKTLRNTNKILCSQNTDNQKKQFITTSFVFPLFKSDQKIIKKYKKLLQQKYFIKFPYTIQDFFREYLK